MFDCSNCPLNGECSICPLSMTLQQKKEVK
jgi:hypothetical protein